MKDKLKLLLRWAGVFVLCFLVIYLMMFLFGWKLFESGDPILIELDIALILSIFISSMNEVIIGLEKRVKSLEERIKDLEEKSANQ